MPESTLSLKVTDIQARLGAYAGFGRGALFSEPAWTATQQAVLDDATQSGLRRFYYPPPVGQMKESYAWSFLRPTALLTLNPGQSTVPLPEDFGGVEGNLTIQTASGVLWGPIRVTNPGEVDVQFAQLPAATGKPVMASVRWGAGTTQFGGQRAELYLWPTADQQYPLQFAYYVLPDYLTTANPYALGGMAHAETVLESCLAVLEERLDDIPMGRGPHGIAFAARLEASVAMDRKSKAAWLGPNLDRSDDAGFTRGWNHVQNPISFGGIVY